MSNPASTETGQYLRFIEGAAIPPLHHVYEASRSLSPARARTLAQLSLGLSRWQIARVDGKQISTVKNIQEEAANTLHVANDREVLTAVAHASGWFEDHGQHLVEDILPDSLPGPVSGVWALSERRREILSLRASGFTVAEIASRESISINTVKNTQAAIMDQVMPQSETGEYGSMHVAVAALWREDLIKVLSTL